MDFFDGETGNLRTGIMRRNTMHRAKFDNQGFTLIASLMLMLLLSGFAIALLMMVNTEQRIGGNDLSNNYVYRSAEGAMEKMTSDLANTFSNIQAPNNTQICNVGNNPPTWDTSMSYPTYSVAPVGATSSVPCPPITTVWGPIQSGPDAGLYAQIMPVTLNVVAQRSVGNAETVSMTRTAEVALIPVFQFGVFCNGDCFFGRSPNLGFAGRVHTNGDLYLGVADNYNLVFGDKISAFGNIIRQQMDNGVVSAGNNNGGTVMIPTTFGGCNTQMANVPNANPSATCVDISAGWSTNPGLASNYGSVEAGHASTQNPAWPNVSTTTFNSYIIDGNGSPGPPPVDGPNATGASDLTLPFVQGTTSAIQIIRRPPPQESTSSLLGSSRLANEAQVRVLLSDTQDGNHFSDWNGDRTQDYQLVSSLPTGLSSLLQAADSTNPGTVANSIQVGATFPISSSHYYSFGESYCTGNTYFAPTITSPATNGTVGTSYATTPSGGATTVAVSGGNKVTTHYNSTTRGCPPLTGTGSYIGTVGLITDTNFVIPPYFGSPSQVWPPTAFPQWPPQTFPPMNPTSTTANFTTVNGGTNGLEWPLIGGWLLVEVKWASDGKWHGVTQEWLQMGFARGLNVPTQPGFGCTSPATNTLTTAAGCNFFTDHKNAILYFQATKDSALAGTSATGIGTVDQPLSTNYYDGSNCGPAPLATLCKSQYNWYPINFYDAREGENNDTQSFTAGTGTPNGIMNAVELDVGNLRNWLLGNTGTSGKSVDFTAQNGYVLFFSDRRGMQFTTQANQTTYGMWGEYGYEDTVNYANATNNFAPDGNLDPNNYNGVSAEDVNSNNKLDIYGIYGVGDAFGPATTKDTDVTSPPSPYAQAGGIAERIPLTTVGLANRVTGARHVLKLVDGSVGNLPVMPAASGCSYTDSKGNPAPTGCGGFTVASENPVYILGNYNSNCPSSTSVGCTPNNTIYDPTWTSSIAAEPNHAAAAIIADAVTMMSNNWQDWGCLTVGATCTNAINQTSGSLVNPFNPGVQSVPAQKPNRIAMNTHYRVAVAGGKTIAFNNTAQNPEFSFGMDGGIHNFLRFIEDWGGTTGTQAQLYYKGSLVSLYWNAYATGTFKCCNLVYNPPDRQYTFDPLFAFPQNLPPGTPMFRNVDNLSYRQNQIYRTN
jgi:Tfp pilus assembly protein PilX